MRFLALVLALSLAGCDLEPLCARADIAPGATTVATGTPVDLGTGESSAACPQALSIANELRERPAASRATLAPAASGVRLVPDVPGTYVVRRTLAGLSADEIGRASGRERTDDR